MSHLSTTPIGGVLIALADAWRANRVSFTSVPADCRPPRLVIEFDSPAQVTDFVRLVAGVAEIVPPVLPVDRAAMALLPVRLRPAGGGEEG